MNKRALIISVNPWPLWIAVERHLARSLSETHVVDGLNVIRLIPSAAPIWTIRDRLYERLERKFARFVRPALNGRDITRELVPKSVRVPPLPSKVADLRGYRVGSSRLGLAALSTSASFARVSSNEAVEDYGPTLPMAWEIAHQAHTVATALPAGDYDEVFIFNGRHCVSRPFCDTLECATTVTRYEAGGRTNSYLLFRGSLHDPDGYAEMVRTHPFDEQAGHAFFHERINREPGTEAFRYTGSQERGSLPEGVEGQPFLTYYSSSPDEFFATSDHSVFGDFAVQGDIALAMARACAETGKKLVVRLHPHLAHKHESWRQEWDFEALKALGATIVWPTDPIDSYALLQASAGIVTCGSTIGIEAAYWGVPSLAVGNHYYNVIGVTSSAASAEEVAAFVRSPQAVPDAREAALRVGSFVKRCGVEVPGFTTDGTMDSARIDGALVEPVRYWLRRLRRAFGR